MRVRTCHQEPKEWLFLCLLPGNMQIARSASNCSWRLVCDTNVTTAGFPYGSKVWKTGKPSCLKSLRPHTGGRERRKERKKYLPSQIAVSNPDSPTGASHFSLIFSFDSSPGLSLLVITWLGKNQSWSVFWENALHWKENGAVQSKAHFARKAWLMLWLEQYYLGQCHFHKHWSFLPLPTLSGRWGEFKFKFLVFQPTPYTWMKLIMGHFQPWLFTLKMTNLKKVKLRPQEQFGNRLQVEWSLSSTTISIMLIIPDLFPRKSADSSACLLQYLPLVSDTCCLAKVSNRQNWWWWGGGEQDYFAKP